MSLCPTHGALKKFFTSTTANVRKLQEKDGINKVFREIPRTICDAIKLVRDLGQRYLWADSICIVQDSTKCWELNAGFMDQVYGNAHFTICAADGDNANAGLKAMNSADRVFSQHIEDYALGVRLMVSYPVEAYIHQSSWNKRAWTFQERLLSRRCLLFVDSRVFFQCRSATMREDITPEEERGWTIDHAQAPLQMLDDLDTKAILLYMKAVEEYTSRELTRPDNILSAFEGVGKMVGKKLGAELLYGLPRSHFDWALLWEPRSAADPRIIPEKDDSLFESIRDIKGLDAKSTQQLLQSLKNKEANELRKFVNDKLTVAMDEMENLLQLSEVLNYKDLQKLEWLNETGNLLRLARPLEGDASNKLGNFVKDSLLKSMAELENLLRLMTLLKDKESAKLETCARRELFTLADEPESLIRLLRLREDRELPRLKEFLKDKVFDMMVTPECLQRLTRLLKDKGAGEVKVIVKKQLADIIGKLKVDEKSNGAGVDGEIVEDLFFSVTKKPLPKDRNEVNDDNSRQTTDEASGINANGENSRQTKDEASGINANGENSRQTKDEASGINVDPAKADNNPASGEGRETIRDTIFCVMAELAEGKDNNAMEEDGRIAKKTIQPKPIRSPRTFPSWSWSGWTGTVMEYKPSLIQGTMDNMHKWLMEHTWIIWYLRDGHGNLTPIWNHSMNSKLLRHSSSDPSVQSTGFKNLGEPTENRWTGYSTPAAGSSSLSVSTDPFGRADRPTLPEIRPFQLTMPEYPYGVHVSDPSGVHEPDVQFADQQYLQFWTWSAYLRLTEHASAPSVSLGSNLQRYGIMDYKGDLCGSIVLNRRQDRKFGTDTEHLFIAISEAKSFDKDEQDGWTYYISKERELSEWDCSMCC